jgi:hypothetical protein
MSTSPDQKPSAADNTNSKFLFLYKEEKLFKTTKSPILFLCFFFEEKSTLNKIYLILVPMVDYFIDLFGQN